MCVKEFENNELLLTDLQITDKRKLGKMLSKKVYSAFLIKIILNVIIMFNELLANIIWIFHISIILFVLLAPFTQIPSILILHITFSVSLLLHWWFNSNVCSLTVIESYLRALPQDNTFMYQLIGPVYNISKTNLNILSYFIVFLTMSVSIYYLYNSKVLKDVLICYNKLTDYSFSNITKCIKPLFT